MFSSHNFPFPFSFDFWQKYRSLYTSSWCILCICCFLDLVQDPRNSLYIETFAIWPSYREFPIEGEIQTPWTLCIGDHIFLWMSLPRALFIFQICCKINIYICVWIKVNVFIKLLEQKIAFRIDSFECVKSLKEWIF